MWAVGKCLHLLYAISTPMPRSSPITSAPSSAKNSINVPCPQPPSTTSLSLKYSGIISEALNSLKKYCFCCSFVLPYILFEVPNFFHCNSKAFLVCPYCFLNSANSFSDIVSGCKSSLYFSAKWGNAARASGRILGIELIIGYILPHLHRRIPSFISCP